MREYFYGPRGDLSPHSQTVRWDELALYAVGGGPRAPTSALPIGARPARLPWKNLIKTLGIANVSAGGRARRPPRCPSVCGPLACPVKP